MTTADEVMPTLREIEQGLRARLEELSRVSGSEAEARAAAKAKVEQVAHAAANNNSIGEAADDLLVELGLHGRPRDVSVYLSVEVRQNVSPNHVRDIYINGAQVYGAYQTVTECAIYNTFDMNVAVLVPRDHEGCACSITIDNDTIDGQLGRMPAGVEIVDTTTKWCGFNSYPYTRGSDEESACLTFRRMREAEKVLAHDSPLVQQCVYGHQYTGPHRHIFYRNGEVTYSATPEYVPALPSVVVPGWYGTDGQVGQPIPVEPEPEPEPALVQQCDIGGHPLHARHLHWREDDGGTVTYTRALDWIAGDGYTRLGVFCRDVDLVGTPVE